MQSAFHGSLIPGDSQHFPIPYWHMATYKQLLPQVLRRMQPTPSTAAYHYVQHFTVEGHSFCTSVFKNARHSHCIVYMIILRNRSKDFEVLARYGSNYFLYDFHFFLRYRQRQAIQHKPAHEVLMHFAKHNPLTVFSRRMGVRRYNPNKQYFMAAIHAGAVYGSFDVQHRVYIFNTIIDQHSLSTIKKRKFGKLRNMLKKLEGE